MKKRDVIIITICVATAIVCMCLTFWGNLKNNGVLTTDAFMGVIATLIGVCATIIVGFQIASYLELRETKIQVEKSVMRLTMFAQIWQMHLWLLVLTLQMIF